jgi:ArsR family transcriptional regulator
MKTKTIPAPHVIEETAGVLRCLGHPIRLAVIDHLERALDIEQATASQHLSLMRDKGILGRRKDGVYVLYDIADERALKVLACIRSG